MQAKASTCFYIVLFSSFSLHAQCGLDPLSGTITINTASQVVNSYYPGQANPTTGSLSLTVGALDARGSLTPLAAGDLILVIQIQGADINSTNSNSYGDGVNTGGASGYLATNIYAGNYEYNSVASVAGSTINLSFSLVNNYYTRAFSSGAIQSYQVIRIPRYYDLIITAAGSVTCPFWNGNTGGMVAIDAANVITLNGMINTSGLGFRGGGGINFTGATAGNTNGTGTLTNTDYRWNSPVTTAANLTGGAKGEGIAGTPVYLLNPGSTTLTTNSVEGYINGAMGRSAPANGGGGATDGAPVGAAQNQYNSGGGGGANSGAGGQGGSGWHGGAGNVTTYPSGGYGGSIFTQGSISRFIMGGGGGAGTANNSTAANQYMSSGGTGGGIILLRAKSYTGTGSLLANGGDAIGVTGAGGNTDAAGGGGAGGTIIAVTRQNVTVGLTGIIANAKGGRGGNMETYFDHGPGGGAGGGLIITNGAFASTDVTGGSNGLTRTGSTGGPINNAYGATPGSSGLVQTITAAPFLKNANNAASPCGTLPITLESFTASINGSTVSLNWKVALAVDFSHFEIEYSNNGSTFSAIDQVVFNPSQTDYRYTQSPVVAPLNYYRLKLVNTDGSFRYSKILLVRTETGSLVLTVYPQPAKDHINVSIAVRQTQRVTFQLFNTTGSKIKEDHLQLISGSNSFIIDNLQQLPAGIYTLKTYIDGRPVTSKIVIAGN
jgi:Secretion system C-terminal sorting domain